MAAAALLLLLAAPAAAFYLPGVAPKSFLDGDPVALKVDKLTSVKSQLPFSYYHLPFCLLVMCQRVQSRVSPHSERWWVEHFGEKQKHKSRKHCGTCRAICR